MEQAPASTNIELSGYLNRVLTVIENQLSLLQKVQPITDVPIRPIIGKIYYFNNAVLPDITGEGYWGYKSTGWVQLG